MYPGNPQGGSPQGGMGSGMRSTRPMGRRRQPSQSSQTMQPMQGTLKSLGRSAQNQGASQPLPSIAAPQMRERMMGRFATPPSAPGRAVPTPRGNAFGLANRINDMRYTGPNEAPPMIPQGFGAGLDLGSFRPPTPIDPAPGMMGSIAPPLGPDAVQDSASPLSRPRGRWGF